MYAIEGAVIACAGIGSRLGLGLPKCMVEVGGRTILSGLIDNLRPHVPRIHVVVGYREEMMIEYCALHHRDVVLVRNPDFRSTNTVDSLMLGSVGFARKVLFLDGDLIIAGASLQRFLERAVLAEHMVGVTRAKSTQAVFVSTASSSDGKSLELLGFHRDTNCAHEWANLFVAPPSLLREGNDFVYQCLEPLLPLPAQEIDLHEIDTPEDLALAHTEVALLSPSP